MKQLLIADKQRFRDCVVITFVFGMIAHGFCYFNANFSHDCLFSLYADEDYFEYMLMLGRFLRPLYERLKGRVVLPLINGVLFLTYFSLASYFITDLLAIKKRSFLIAACGILVTNYTITLLNASYLHDADSYALALLLAVSGVWIVVKFSRQWFILSIACYFLSLGIYQAYIQVVIYILLIIAARKLMNGETIKDNVMWLVGNAIKLVIAVILFYAVYRLSLQSAGLQELSGYNSPSGTISLTIEEIHTAVINTVYLIRGWFSDPKNVHANWIGKINSCLSVIGIFLVVFACMKKHMRGLRATLFFLYVAMMPMGMSIICLAAGMGHDLMVFSFFISYLVILSLAEFDAEEQCLPVKVNKAMNVCIVLFCGILIFDNVTYSNQAYVKKELENQTTLSTMNRIIDRIEQTDDYVVGETPVVFIGTLYDSQTLNQDRKGFDYGGTGMWFNFAVTYEMTYQSYFEECLNYPINLQTGDAEFWEKDSRVQKMSVFPGKGSCQMLDGTMIIKLSE